MIRTHIRRACWLLAAVITGGCTGGGASEATTVLSYNRCEGLDAGLREVDYQAVAAIRGSTLIGAEEAPAQAGDLDRPDGDELLLVAISRGEQPTAGYGMSLDEVRRRDGTAVIHVQWQTPEPGAALAQMITHPCLVVGLPRDGIQRIEAVDQTGETLGRLTL